MTFFTPPVAPPPLANGGRFELGSTKAAPYRDELISGELGQMRKFSEKGFPVIGALFLVLGIFKLIQGDSWVVWFILGVVFGGLGLFSRRKDKKP